jgi:hypothetical protein
MSSAAGKPQPYLYAFHLLPPDIFFRDRRHAANAFGSKLSNKLKEADCTNVL